MVEQVFVPMREVCCMHNAQWGERGQRADKIFMFTFFCLVIKYEFYFTVTKVWQEKS